MKDPTRMTQGNQDGTDVTSLELELVRAGRDARLASRDKQEIWIGISAQCLPGPVAPDISTATAGSGVGAAAASTSGGALAAVKGTILAVVLAGGSVAGYQVWQHRSGPAVVAPAETAPLGPAETATESATEKAPPVQQPAPPHAVAPRSPMSAARKPQPSRLGAEGGVVLEARRDLREGRPEDALRLLDAARTEFADGALVQEREALSIEALSRSGQHAVAGLRATAFLRAFPRSPHAASVKSFAGR